MRTRWRTSSYSGGNGGACIEVTSQDDSGRILVRDSKNRQGAALRFTPAAWHAFTRRVKADASGRCACASGVRRRWVVNLYGGRR